MRKLFLSIIILTLSLPMATHAHPGPLDSYGGHTDSNNVSAYGDYHYHCGEYPAHPHPRGVCVYDESQGPIIDSPPESDAAPTTSTVLVNGRNVSFDAYKIFDNNYFKLRDLAYVLNGTAKQFAIGWDSANDIITLTSGQPYTAVGGEMAKKGSGNKTALPTSSKIYLNGREIQLTAYKIDGNNYFKLRDIGEALNFGVIWDGARNTISIDTSRGY